MSGRTLITGASYGIGRDLAGVFASHGHDLVVVARNRERLERMAADLPVRVQAVVADLSTDEGVREVLNRVKGPVEILVNNAGTFHRGRFDRMREEESEEMIRLNISTLTRLTRSYLPGMVQARRGRILNMASTAAFQPGPTMAVYFATKAYVLSFSEALHEELRGTGVTVTAVCPGPIRSRFKPSEGAENESPERLGAMSGDRIAKTAYKAVMKGKPVLTPGFGASAGALLVRLTPRWFVRRVVKKVLSS